jgi:hypothetical protein
LKKYIRVVLMLVAVLVLLGVAGWYFAVWSVGRGFESAMKGGGPSRVANALEAALGSTLARGDARLTARGAAGEGELLKPGGPAGEGAIAYYQKNPQVLKRDKEYFETWSSALIIAEAASKGEHRLGRWESSARAPWVARSQKTDAWGQAYCIRSDQQWTIVVSPGPQAHSALDCEALKIPEAELARMPQGRLNPLASGSLILLFGNRK